MIPWGVLQLNKKQKNIIVIAMIKTLVVVYIVVFIIGMVKLLNGSRPEDYLLELMIVFLAPVIGYFFLRSRTKFSFPMSIAGLAVKPDATRRAKKGRIRAYILDSLQYAVVIALFIGGWDLLNAYRGGRLASFGLNGWFDAIGAILLQFTGFFVLYFAMNYLIYEYKAKKIRAPRTRKEKRKKAYKEIMEVKSEDDAE